LCFKKAIQDDQDTDRIQHFLYIYLIKKKKTSKNPVKTSLRWFSFSKQVQDRVSQKHQKPKQIVEITGTNGLFNLLRLREKQSRLFYSTWLIFWIGFKLVRGKKRYNVPKKNIFSWSTRLFYKEKHVSTPISLVFQPILARCFELSGSQCYTNPALTALLQEVLVTAGLTKICHLFTTVGWMSAKNLAVRLSITSVHLAQRLIKRTVKTYVRLQVFTADPQR